MAVAIAVAVWFIARSPEAPPDAAPAAPATPTEASPDAPPSPTAEARPDLVAPPSARPDSPEPAAAQPTPRAASPTGPTSPMEDAHRVQRALEEWVLAPVNRHANARALGADCRLSICTLEVVYDGVSDSHFFTRAEEWFMAQPGPGRPMTYPHRVDAHTFKVWYFWSPHEAGTPENHRFVEAVTERIRAEIGEPPDDPYHYVR